jgi:hypothetical protein
MNNTVESHLTKSRKSGGEFAFSLHSLCRLPNLSIEDIHDLLRVRLRAHGWKGGVPAFLSKEAFLALALASSNHPRRAVRVLAEAMRAVADTRKATRRIDLRSMREGAANADCPLDEKDWLVLDFLSTNGQASANDAGLRKALDYATPKRADGYSASVDRRLRSVAVKLRLEFFEVPSGRTKKHVLFFPELPKGW